MCKMLVSRDLSLTVIVVQLSSASGNWPLHLERNDTAIYRGIAQNRIGSDFSRSIARWNILPANQRSLRHTASRSAGLIGFLQRVVFFRMEFSTRFNTSANCAWDIRKYAWNLSSSEWSSRTSLWYSPSCDLFRKVSCTQKRRFFNSPPPSPF